jgi:hypothetical protein
MFNYKLVNGIYVLDKDDIGVIPIRQDIEILGADKPVYESFDHDEIVINNKKTNVPQTSSSIKTRMDSFRIYRSGCN